MKNCQADYSSVNRQPRVQSRPLSILRTSSCRAAGLLCHSTWSTKSVARYPLWRCVDGALARLEGAIAIGTLVRRLPNLRLAVAAGALRWRATPVLCGLEALPVKI